MSHDRHLACKGMFFKFAIHKSYIVAYGLLMSISISGALLKYFGASSATGQDEPPTSPTTQDSAGMVSNLLDELPSMSSATHMSPHISDIEDEDLFASTSTQHETSGGFLHISLSLSVCVCVCACVCVYLCRGGMPRLQDNWTTAI